MIHSLCGESVMGNNNYHWLTTNFKYSCKFADSDRNSGNIKDLLDYLNGHHSPYEIYYNKSNNGCEIFYGPKNTLTYSITPSTKSVDTSSLKEQLTFDTLDYSNSNNINSGDKDSYCNTTFALSLPEQFEKETNVALYCHYNNTYIVTSGQSVKQIKPLMYKFNKEHSTNVVCYDDTIKDATYIIFT